MRRPAVRCLIDPDLKVPAHLVGQLLDLAATQAHEPAFGLRLAASRRLSNLGPLALLVRDAPTLRRALETLMHYIHVHNEAMAVQVDEHGGLVVDPHRAGTTAQGRYARPPSWWWA